MKETHGKLPMWKAWMRLVVIFTFIGLLLGTGAAMANDWYWYYYLYFAVWVAYGALYTDDCWLCGSKLH